MLPHGEVTRGANRLTQPYGNLVLSLVDAHQAATRLHKTLATDVQARQVAHALALRDQLFTLRRRLVHDPATAVDDIQVVIDELRVMQNRCIGELESLRPHLERALALAAKFV